MANPIEELDSVVVLGFLLGIALLAAWAVSKFDLFGASATEIPPGATPSPYVGAGGKAGEAQPSYNNPFTYPWGALWTNLKNVFSNGLVPANPSDVAAAVPGSSLSDYNPGLEPDDLPAISEAFANWS
jgi:hypothetical protein